jgi:hypothetical protein
MSRPAPFPAWRVRQVLIIAAPIAPKRWRYRIVPEGRPAVVAYCLARARETAARYSRKIVEVGSPAAFRRRAA